MDILFLAAIPGLSGSPLWTKPFMSLNWSRLSENYRPALSRGVSVVRALWRCIISAKRRAPCKGRGAPRLNI